MLLYNALTEDSLIHEMDRICGSEANSQSFKDKIARLNAALDKYFAWAFESDDRWSYDDINETSPPIDTQSIVSGTNRYKFSAFTEKILSLIRLEILDSGGKGLSLIPETFDSVGFDSNVNVSGRIRGTTYNNFQKEYIDAPAGTPTHYIKYGDFIYLRPNPNYSKTNGLLAYFNRPAVKFVFTIVTVTAATDLFAATAHGLLANDTVIFETDGTIPTGVTADLQYYVISSGLTSDVFKVSTTKGGSTIDVTDAQAGSNHSFLKTNAEAGIPENHHPKLARIASLPFLIDKKLPQRIDNGVLVQQDELAIKKFFSRRTKDIPSSMHPYKEYNEQRF